MISRIRIKTTTVSGIKWDIKIMKKVKVLWHLDYIFNVLPFYADTGYSNRRGVQLMLWFAKFNNVIQWCFPEPLLH